MTASHSSWQRSLLLRGLGAFLLANVLLLYAPTTPLALGLIALLALAAMCLDHRHLLPMAISFTLVTLALEGFVRWGTSGLTPYFRPHEVLALETSYRPNRQVEMDVAHGDLLVIDKSLPTTLATARRERFVTDSFGYRNDRDYHGQRVVIVGDSFLVGTSSTLSSVLLRDFGFDVYNVSFSGMGPLIYADKVAWARQQLGNGDSCVALFYFEGNDFQLVDGRELAVRDAMPKGLQEAAKRYVRAVRGHSEWSKTFFGLMSRAQEQLRSATREESEPEPERTLVKSVGRRPMAFLKGYADVVHRTTFDDHGFVASRLEAAPPDLVVFIPDKYRVYAPLFDDHPEPELPHMQWQHLKGLADSLSIPAIDLTPPLVARSRELLVSGETTFWTDDTHWNQRGEQVAAEVFLRALADSGLAKCRPERVVADAAHRPE